MAVVQTTQCKKDKKQRKRRNDFQKLKTAIDLLIASEPLPDQKSGSCADGKMGWLA